jgi:hypothetical protein
VWKATTAYRPKAVIIEFNPTIPTEVHFVQPADSATSQGCSLSALAALGKEKGYELVSVLPFNAVFVRSDYYPLFGIADNSPQALRKDLGFITYLFAGYDGTLFLRGCGKLPWHGMELSEKRIQHLPAYLRRFPGNYSRLQSNLYFLYSSPGRFARGVLRRITRSFRRRA